MHIKFRLPSGAGGAAAGTAVMIIKKRLELWGQKYNMPYETEIDGYALIVKLPADQDYTFFKLSWESGGFYGTMKFDIIDSN